MAQQSEGPPGSYDAEAETLLSRWAALSVESVCAPVLDRLCGAPGRALDIGTGAGTVAAWLAKRGWAVSATEPSNPLREGAQRLNAGLPITWSDACLPDLAGINAAERFDLIACFAVLMHIPPSQLNRAFVRMAALLADRGQILVSLRHGPLPEGRGMYPMQASHVIGAAKLQGLGCARCEAHPSVQRGNQAAGVVWTWMVFEPSVDDG